MSSLASPRAYAPFRHPIALSQRGLLLDELVRLATEHRALEVSTEVRATVALGRSVVEHVLERGDVAYGLNTHLGHRRDQLVDGEKLADYQRFIVTTHAAGVGESLTIEQVRAVLGARLVGMARGGSGVSLEVFDLLVEFLNRGVHPVIPSMGSVGAADITQLAAVAEVLIGEGTAEVNGRLLSGKEALAHVGLEPAVLQPKDALTIISSNAVSLGLGALTLHEVDRLTRLADVAGALTLEATRGNLIPFSQVVAGAKPFAGQQQAAGHVRRLLHGGDVERPHATRSVQDALSIRTLPQVHGALRDQLGVTRRALEGELNALADNPLVSLVDDALVSSGNFSPMTMALGFEGLRVAMAHVAMVSERRLHKLLAARRSLKPHAKLAELSGRGRVPDLIVNAAAALLAQLKHAAQPITLSGVSLNCDVEDHASLAPQAIAATRHMAGLLEQLLVIEVLLAADTFSLLPEAPKAGRNTLPVYQAVDAVLQQDNSSATVVESLRASLRNVVR